jgi:hypothetical protein
VKNSTRRYSYPRTGSRFSLSPAVAAIILLSGCSVSGQQGPPAPSSAGTASAPGQSPGPLESPEPLDGESAGPTPVGSAANGKWGTYGSRANACEGVAGNVITLSLLPVSLDLGGTEEDLAGLENEVQEIKEAAPAELKDEFAQVQLLVDSFGDQLSTQPGSSPEGKSAAGEGPVFDADALNETLDSVRAWLTENCADR